METFNVWDAFNKSRAATDTSNLAGLQGATGAANLAALLHKSQMENKFRQEIGAATTSEERSAVAAKYASPSDIFKRDTESADAKLRTDATKEQARGRLQQAAQQFTQMMDLRIGAAKTAQEKLLLEQQKAQGMLTLQAEHARQVGEANKYNFGIPTADIATPQVTVGKPPVAGAPTTTIAPSVSPADIAGITDPAERAAAQAALQGGKFSAPNPANVYAGGGGQPAPVATPSPSYAAPPPPAPVLPSGPTGNQDVRDIRAQLGPQAPPAIQAQLGPQPLTLANVPPPAETPAGPVMPKFTGSPRAQDAAKNKWLADQSKTSIAGAGMLSPEALKFTAGQMLAGDKSAGQGYARNSAMKTALQNAFTTEAMRRGISPEEAASRMAEYEGFKSGQRTVGTRQANIEIAANVTDQFAPIAIAASAKYDRPAWKSFVDLQNLANDKTQSPELRQFAFANLSLVNAYARAINPQGVGNQKDKEHALEVLNTGFSKGDYKAAVDQLQVEIAAELKAPGKVRQQMRESFVGGANSETPSPQNRRTTDQPGAVKKFNPATGKIE